MTVNRSKTSSLYIDSTAIGARMPPIIQRIGQVIAYIAVPASLFSGGSLTSLYGVLTAFYAISIFGIIAVLRGSQIPRAVKHIGLILFSWFIVLLLIEFYHAGAGLFTQKNDFLKTYIILIAFPFFAVGLLETQVEIKLLDTSAAVTIVIATLWSSYNTVFLDVLRPRGLDGMHSIPFSMVVVTWGTYLLSRSLTENGIKLAYFNVSLIALIPIIISGSKITWTCTIVGYLSIIVWWCLDHRRWRALIVSIILTLLLGSILSQISFVQERILRFLNEMVNFMQSGDTSGASFGPRFSATVSGYLAFFDRPLLGYGSANTLSAALAHRPEWLSDFSQLYHVHNGLVYFPVAFGILGLLFISMLMACYIYAAHTNADRTIRHFSIVMVLSYAIFMQAALFFPFSPTYGLFFFMLGTFFVPK